MTGLVPGKSFRCPAGRVSWQHEVEKFFQIGEFTTKDFPVLLASLDESGELFQLLTADGGLDIEPGDLVQQRRLPFGQRQIPLFVGDDMLLLVLEHPDAARARLAALFDRIDTLPPATITLRGRVLATVSVLRGSRLRTWPPQ